MGQVNTFEDGQEVTERCKKIMTLYLSIENWLYVENRKQVYQRFYNIMKKYNISVFILILAHSAQSNMVRTVKKHLHIQSIRKGKGKGSPYNRPLRSRG